MQKRTKETTNVPSSRVFSQRVPTLNDDLLLLLHIDCCHLHFVPILIFYPVLAVVYPVLVIYTVLVVDPVHVSHAK